MRAERERARWRLHMVHHRVTLKNRVHATLVPSVTVSGQRPVQHEGRRAVGIRSCRSRGPARHAPVLS